MRCGTKEVNLEPYTLQILSQNGTYQTLSQVREHNMLAAYDVEKHSQFQNPRRKS